MDHLPFTNYILPRRRAGHDATMTIHEISQESIRRLGATQVITDPITVIKELVENALDAQATSVIVEASSDLVSHIQVKDNGGGIDPADRPLMAKPHCTSKISTFDDLLDVATLGFRGEALASLAAVSGGLTITTRVKDEAIAVACEISRDGSLKTISPVSAPVGCAVKVKNLFANFPVRKAALEKGAARQLAQIRPLLLSYYLTHPATRFQFKCVAGSQANQGKKKIDAKYDVIFAASTTKEQAVVKSFGAEPCRYGQWVRHGADDDGIQVEAFLVKPDADAAAVSKKGVCIAYKNRPLSITRARGLAHSIYSAYKRQIKAVFAVRSTGPPTEPFLFLNILSGAGKADVNIEPAKDDVLFESNEKVMSCIEGCFERVYGGNKVVDSAEPVTEMSRHFSSEVTEDSAVPSEMVPYQASKQMVASVTISPARRDQRLSSSPPIKISSSAANAANCIVQQQPDADSVEAQEDDDNDDDDESCLQLQRENDTPEPEPMDDEVPPTQREQPRDSDWSFSMYGSGIDDDDDFVDIEETLRESEKNQIARDESIRGDASIANPWTMSKMNARVSHAQTGVPRSIPRATVTVRTASELDSRHSQQQSPRATPPSTAPVIEVPTPSAPVAKMSASGSPWYQIDINRSSPNTRVRNQPSPRRLSDDALPTPPRSERPRKPTRKSTGPMDSWISGRQTQEAEYEEQDNEDGSASPPKIFFGKPDLRMSSTQGDGGRGIFPSASDRMRNRQNLSNAPTAGPDDDDNDDISFSEDEELMAALTRRRRLEPIRISLDQDFFKKPSSKEPTKPTPPVRPRNPEAHTVMRKSKFLVTKVPRIDLQRLQFRTRLVQDDLYIDDYDSRNAPVSEPEMRKVFFGFLGRYIASGEYSDDAELEQLQRDIVDGRISNVKFRNLADT
ncbi:hypothetical protein Dda_1311 [Drechslerella dactyloides]|uniref:DNA mismatch repair protein S5 domain-containing protein n=1 Tax=Drechslerella dactyloides TaxID=74499 RepID=A0AAD6J1H3_DREDA|nr:hypothetical protein Dda_1311 [Drechslerella dactyloides]